MTIVVLQVVVIAAFAPLVQGAMKLLRARWQGRPGPSPLQPYRDLSKLWSKEALLPEGVSVVTVCAPGVALGVALTFAAALPLQSRQSSVIDVVALVLLLALGRFLVAVAALDMGSTFTGMAASREMTFASLVEPTLLVALLAGPSPLTFASFFLVLLLETARIPIDNQETHYELTMMHEGLTLEYAGWQLAIVQYAAYIRQLAFVTLASTLLFSGNLALELALIPVIAVAITAVESLFAKLRLFEIPQLLTTAFILAVTSIALRLAGIAL